MKHILLIATAALLATAVHVHAKARHHVARHHAAASHKVYDQEVSKPQFRLAHRSERHARLPHRS